MYSLLSLGKKVSISGHLGLLKYVSLLLSCFKHIFDFLLWSKMGHVLTVGSWRIITTKVTMLLEMVQVEKAVFQSSLSVLPVSRVWREKKKKSSLPYFQFFCR